MFFIYGSRLFGKVDEVPGLFHVATRFGHLNFCPLIPLATYVVLAQNGKQFRGVKISLSAKSVFVGYGRAATFLAGVIAGIAALATYSSRRSDDFMVAAAIASVGWIGFALLMWYPGVRRASFNRACYIGRSIGLNSHGMAAIEHHFGQAAARGFEVVPPAAPAPAPAAPPTFLISGRERESAKEVCYTVVADSAQIAQQLAEEQNIEVQRVDPIGPVQQPADSPGSAGVDLQIAVNP